MERTKERSRENDKEEKRMAEGKVTISRKNLEERVRVKVGSTLADVIAEIRKQMPDFALKNFNSVMLNGRSIRIKEDGTLEENPTITGNFVLSVLQNFTGG